MTDITLPREPPDELIEAMARDIYAESYRPHEELTERNLNATFGATAHDGDCTKKCYTCLKCEGDLGRRMARAAYAALVEHLREKGNG